MIRSLKNSVPLLPLVAFVVAFALIPALVLFSGGWIDGGGLSGWEGVLADPLNQAALGNSFTQGLASAAIALALGFPAGVFLGRYRGRGRPLLLALFLVPFLLPVLVMVQGVQTIFGPQGYVTSVVPWASTLGAGWVGVVTVNLAFNIPIVVLLTAVGVESAPRNLESNVATLGGGPWVRFRDVWARPAILGAAAGGLVTFLFSALAFASPLLVCGAQCYTIEVRVWALSQELGQPSAAALLGLLLVFVFALPAFLYLLSSGRLGRGSASGGSARLASWPRPVGSALALWTGALLAGELSIVAVVVLESYHPSGGGGWGTEAWNSLFSSRVSGQLQISTWGALANSLLFASIAAAIAVLLGIVAGFWVRRRARGSLPLRLLLLLPLLLSPVLLAFALSEVWGPLLAGSASVWWLILLSQTTIALPFAVPTLVFSLLPLSPRPREAAEMLGASPFVAFLETELPRARTGLVSAALLAFVIGLGEFTATLFLATPPFTTLPVEFYRLDALREPLPAAACAALLALVALGAVAAIGAGGRRVVL